MLKRKLSSKRKSLTSILSHTHAQIINLQRALCQGRWSWTMALVKWSYTGGKKETQHFIKADKSDWGLLQKVPMAVLSVYIKTYINCGSVRRSEGCWGDWMFGAGWFWSVLLICLLQMLSLSPLCGWVRWMRRVFLRPST